MEPISATDARRLCRSLHYSGTVVPNSRVHLGVFLHGRCGGVLQFGPSLDQSKLIGLVRGTQWGEFLELNRMALADWLPRNSESRALGVALRLLRKAYPHLKWCVSFADASQCGDGAIYRASGFVLTQVRPASCFIRLPSGRAIMQATLTAHPTTPRPELGGRTYYDVSRTGGGGMAGDVEAVRGEVVRTGFMLRYVYFLHPAERANLTCPVLPFAAIAEAGAGMYRGRPVERGSFRGRTPGHQPGDGGSNPTTPLQNPAGKATQAAPQPRQQAGDRPGKPEAAPAW